MIHPMIVKEAESILTISGDRYQKLKKKPKAILWCRHGLYGMIPVEVIKNAIQHRKDLANATGCSPIPFIGFLWSETQEILPETGRAMEEYNGKE